MRGSQPRSATSPPLIVTQTQLHLTVEAFRGAVRNVDEAENDEVTNELVEQGPQMFMEQKEEVRTRKEALSLAVDAAEENGLPLECIRKLRRMVLHTHEEAFRSALVGELPARMDPMEVTLKPGSWGVRAKPRVYPPDKAKWLRTHMQHMVSAGMVYQDHQVVYSSAAMAIP